METIYTIENVDEMLKSNSVLASLWGFVCKDSITTDSGGNQYSLWYDSDFEQHKRDIAKALTLAKKIADGNIDPRFVFKELDKSERYVEAFAYYILSCCNGGNKYTTAFCSYFESAYGFFDKNDLNPVADLFYYYTQRAKQFEDNTTKLSQLFPKEPDIITEKLKEWLKKHYIIDKNKYEVGSLGLVRAKCLQHLDKDHPLCKSTEKMHCLLGVANGKSTTNSFLEDKFDYNTNTLDDSKLSVKEKILAAELDELFEALKNK